MNESKESLRKRYISIRKIINAKRKEEAASECLNTLLPLFSKSQYVASYFPINNELDVSFLNKALLEEKKLCLPRMQGKDLVFSLVKSFNEDLSKGQYGILEPLKHCPMISLSSIESILVPALVVDCFFYRIGYGMGYYDRVLKGYKGNSYVLAYKEQLSPFPIPKSSHDIPCKASFLF